MKLYCFLSELFSRYFVFSFNESLNAVNQWFSTGVPRNPRVPPVQSMGSARSYSNLILLFKLNAFFLHKTNELLQMGSSSHWNVFLGFRSSKKVGNHYCKYLCIDPDEGDM